MEDREGTWFFIVLALAGALAWGSCVEQKGGADTDAAGTTDGAKDSSEQNPAPDGTPDTGDAVPDADVCKPGCENAECGDDGCGGTCGTCPADHPVCVMGACTDCPPECENAGGECDPALCGPDAATAPDAVSEAEAQQPDVCVPQCDGKQCGDDGCGGICGACPESTPLCSPGGQCYGAGDCSDFVPAGTAFRMPFLGVGDGGHPGEALDIDGSSETCAPVQDCEQGYDNMMTFAKDVITPDDPAEADTILGLAPGFNLDGAAFSFGLTSGRAAGPVEACDWNQGDCPHEVSLSGLDPFTCGPLILFDDAVVAAGKLHAGGPGTVLVVYIMPGYLVPLHLYDAQLEATVQSKEGKMWLEGVVLGFALSPDEVHDFVCEIPDPSPFPVSCDMIELLYSMSGDIDVDGDGIGDAASVGMKFKGMPATLVGTY